MGLFQAKIDWKKLRKIENKNYRSVPYLPDRLEEKIAKKFWKIKKYDYGIISSQNRLEKADKETKLKLPFRSFPTQPVIENSKKKTKKFLKTRKYHYGFSSSQNRMEKAEKETK